MNRWISSHAAVLFISASLIACNRSHEPPSPPVLNTQGTSSPSQAAASAVNDAPTIANGANIAKPALARNRTIANPSAAEIVMLYHSLAGTRPPIERWTEESFRLNYASPPDKAEVRADLHAELEVLSVSVHDVGRLRISLRDAALSTYDPTYGEFTIGALSPGTSIPFEEYRQRISIRLDNAHVAQLWKISPEQAREVTDKLGQYPQTSIDLVLDVVNAVPSPNGGSITAKIVEYEIHDANRRGSRIVRNTVP